MVIRFSGQNGRYKGREFRRILENGGLPARQFSKMITVAWLTLGIASAALAVIAALVLHSEAQSTAIVHHLNLLSLNLQAVLSDLADAEAKERGYVLTGKPGSLEEFENSRRALSLEFARLAALVKNNSVELQEVERLRDLVQQQLDELQTSISSRKTAGSRTVAAEILTNRAREITEALRQSIYGIDKENEGALVRLARKRRVRLATALGAVCGALLLACSYLLVGQIVMSRTASQRREAEEALRASETRFATLC